MPLPVGVTALIAQLGRPVATLRPSSMLMLAQVGSAMYGLATPASDRDYFIVYARDTEDVLSELSCACYSLPGCAVLCCTIC